MSVLNVLLSFVDAFAASSKSIQGSWCWIFVSILLQIISLTTHNWVNLNSQTQGLWTNCKEDGEYTCCESVEKYIFSLQTDVPGWIHATRALQIMAFITAICSAVITTFSIDVETQTTKLKLFKASIIASEITGVLILLSVTVYGSRYRYEVWLNNGSLSASFGLSTATGVSFVVIGILIAGSMHVKRTFAVNSVGIQQQNRTDTQGVAPSVEPQHVFNTAVTPSAPWAPPTPSAEERTLHGGVHIYNTHAQGFRMARPTPSSGERTLSRRVNNEENQCAICMNETIQTVFLPCGHSKCCIQCANIIQIQTGQCPICRQHIASWNRIYH